MYQEGGAGEPAEAAWASLLHHVEARLADRDRSRLPLGGGELLGSGPNRGVPRRRWHSLAYVAAGLTAVAAAAVLLALLVPGPQNPSNDTRPLRADDNEVFTVASTRDILITSMDDDDADLLIVGEAPLPGPIVLATPDDVRIEKIEQDTDGMLPKRLTDWPNMPMIIAPLQPGPDDEE
jgi:hypothetical protein